MIIMFLGDTHADRAFTKNAIDVAVELGVDRLIQVGDFGYWPNIQTGQAFLGEVGRHAHKAGMPFYWLRGNHEDHDAADLMFGTDIPDADNPFQHGKYLTYIRNGARWEWEGVTFGALGGAYSIDRNQRRERNPHWGWFRQETPDPRYIPNLGKVDVLVTHEAPCVPAPLLASGKFWRVPGSDDSQRVVYAALTSAQPTWLVHGHWHVNYRSGVAGTDVWGLDCNQNSIEYAACIFDTEARKMYSLLRWQHVMLLSLEREDRGEETKDD